jgi:hypothetical protein
VYYGCGRGVIFGVDSCGAAFSDGKPCELDDVGGAMSGGRYLSQPGGLFIDSPGQGECELVQAAQQARTGVTGRVQRLVAAWPGGRG